MPPQANFMTLACLKPRYEEYLILQDRNLYVCQGKERNDPEAYYILQRIPDLTTEFCDPSRTKAIRLRFYLQGLIVVWDTYPKNDITSLLGGTQNLINNILYYKKCTTMHGALM